MHSLQTYFVPGMVSLWALKKNTVLSSRTLGDFREVRPCNAVLQLILQGWGHCFGEKGSWEAGELFTEGATTESDFEVNGALP